MINDCCIFAKKMIGEAEQRQMNKELVAWIDAIPFSKPTKNLTRDFSDAVLMAEMLKLYYPRYVELHNYAPANNISTKMENWNTLNRKVLTKLDMKLHRDTIHHLAHASQGAIETLLSELRTKILRDEEEIQKPRIVGRNVEDTDTEVPKEKIEEKSSSRGSLNAADESLNSFNADNEISQISRFSGFKRGALFLFSWIFYFFSMRNIFNYCKLPPFGRHKHKRIALTEQDDENTNEETVPRTIYTKLRQELRSKQEIICTLNHKIEYLESSMKLKDTRIANLTAQVLRNMVEVDDSVNLRSDDIARTRSRLRSHNEMKSNNTPV